jgi:hypothetical protein
LLNDIEVLQINEKDSLRNIHSLSLFLFDLLRRNFKTTVQPT